jgi:hypothetical protein
MRVYKPFMHESINILTAERDGDDGLIVTFSDGTRGAYVVEELLELRPIRERARTESGKDGHQNSGTVMIKTANRKATPRAARGR